MILYKLKISVLIFFFILFSGCQSPLDVIETDIDPRLIGEWYKVDVSPMAFPGPESVYSGWSIAADGSMHPLGVEGSTGEITLIETQYISEIQHTSDGVMIVEHRAHPILTIDSVEYRIRDEELILQGEFIRGTYRKTKEGRKVASPVASYLNVTIDGSETENIEITNRVPSAYISKLSGTRLRLRAEMAWQRISIAIDNFEGRGTYIIGKEQGSYSAFGTDWLGVAELTDADSSGTITIDNCDMTVLRCSGSFEFVMRKHVSEYNQNSARHLTDGMFDVPIYR